MQPQMQPASYPSLHGNGPYAAQPMSAPYSAHQPQYGSYGNDIGVGHQQQPGVMLGNPGAIQQNTDHNIASQYGYGHSSGALHDGQHVPHALGPGTMPVDPRVLPSNQAIGVGVTASVPAMVGGASGLQPPMGTSQMTGQGLGISEGFPCVRLRGLPFESTEQDVEGWLETEPLDIILVRRNGILTGEAFVLLRLPMQVEHVLSKNKTYLGTRYVEVGLAKKLDFYREIYIMVRDDEDSKLAMRSQGRSSREHSRSSRHDSPPRKRSSRRDSSRDRSSKRHHRDEPRERDRIDAEPAERPERHGRPAAAEQDHTGIIKMRGLPFAATADEVVDWFSGTAPAITSDRVHVVMSRGNRPMGTAFVQFASIEDAQSAMAMDRKTMGSRYIELFASNVGESGAHGAPFA